MCLTAQELVPNLYECCNHTGMCITKSNNININQVNRRPIETPPLSGAFGLSTYIPRSTYHRLTYFRISRSARVKSSPHHEQRSTHLKSSPRSPITARCACLKAAVISNSRIMLSLATRRAANAAKSLGLTSTRGTARHMSVADRDNILPVSDERFCH